MEVHESATVFYDMEATTADLRGLLDCLCGLQWMTAGMKHKSAFPKRDAALRSAQP